MKVIRYTSLIGTEYRIYPFNAPNTSLKRLKTEGYISVFNDFASPFVTSNLYVSGYVAKEVTQMVLAWQRASEIVTTLLVDYDADIVVNASVTRQEFEQS